MSEDTKMLHIRIPKKLWVYYKKKTIKDDKNLTEIILEILENYKEHSKENIDRV